MVRNAGLNLRKGRLGRSDGHRRYQLTRLSDTISHGGTKKPPRNRNRGSSLAGRPRDTMLIGQTYAKDAGRSCSDLPNYCDYAPRFRAEERGLLRGRKPKLLRSRFIQRPLNQICCSAVAKLLGRGKRLLKEADEIAALRRLSTMIFSPGLGGPRISIRLAG